MKLTKTFFDDIRGLISSARATVARGVDLVQVHTNFEIGRRIVEQEQKGKGRAAYGQEVIKQLAERLTEEFGRGYATSSLEYMRKFFVAYQDRAAISQSVIGKSILSKKSQSLIGKLGTGSREEIAQAASNDSTRSFSLSWTHYIFLLGIKNPEERSFCEIESAAQDWTVRELKRQFDTSLYERLALSRDKAGIRKLAKEGQIIANDKSDRFMNFFSSSPNGAPHASLGQRPRSETNQTSQALKGRHKPCLNHWLAFTSISFSAPKTGKILFPTRSAPHCTPTWRPSFKTSAAIRFSSIPWGTTCIFSSISHAPWPSAKPLRMLKNHPQNGSKPKVPGLAVSPGNRDTEHSPFPNPMWRRLGNTSPIRKSITGERHFKRNTESSWSDIRFHSMKNMFGIDPRFGPPRALPFAIVACPVGAEDFNNPSPNGANHESPGQRPGNGYQFNRAPTGRHNTSAQTTPVRSPLQGLEYRGIGDPGRCPGLACGRPLALKRKSGGGR